MNFLKSRILWVGLIVTLFILSGLGIYLTTHLTPSLSEEDALSTTSFKSLPTLPSNPYINSFSEIAHLESKEKFMREYRVVHTAPTSKQRIEFVAESPDCSRERIWLETDFNALELGTYFDLFRGKMVRIYFLSEDQLNRKIIQSVTQIEVIQSVSSLFADRDKSSPIAIEDVRICPHCFNDTVHDVELSIHSALLLDSDEIFLTAQTDCGPYSTSLMLRNADANSESLLNELTNRQILLKEVYIKNFFTLTIDHISDIHVVGEFVPPEPKSY